MHDDESNPAHPFKPGFRSPARTSTIGMYLFLAALFMLFAAGLTGYIIIRLRAASEGKLDLGHLQVPTPLWISTIIVMTASFTIHRALHELRREHQGPFRRWLMLTLLLAIAFVIVQAPSMSLLLVRQRSLMVKKIALYALVFTLILLHALHVVGGIVALSVTWKHAREDRYDHEHYFPVRYVALYWHFLDAVWIVMFATFELMK